MQKQHITEAANLKEGIVVPFDVPEFHLLTQAWQPDGSIRVEVIASAPDATCPHCQCSCNKLHDTRARKKRDMALGAHRIELIVWKRRFHCLVCQKVFTERDTTCGWKRRTTVRLREAIGKQAYHLSVAHVAATYEVGARFVQACFEDVATKEIESKGGNVDETRALETPRFIGIDEFAVRKGIRYNTLLCDLEHRRVLDVHEGRTQGEVDALLKRLDTPQAVQAVSMDMSTSFRAAAKRCLPQAQVVVDHFHVMQHVMEAFRKVLSSWVNKKESKILLYRKQHLFLRAPETLTQEQQNERARIGAQLPVLERAWQLKEALRTWYATATADTAAQELDSWIERVRQQGPEPLCKALSAFVNWREEILAFFHFLPDQRISNGFVEGKNNRTKALMRQAYGYRNCRHLRLRILLGNVG